MRKSKVLPFTPRRRARGREAPAGIEHLEPAVHALEERLITAALARAQGSTYEASRLLGLRDEEALKFILRRHPRLTERRYP